MKTRFSTIVGLAAGLLVGVSTAVQAQLIYMIDEGTVTITGHTGPGGDAVIPETITGLPVTSIGDRAFAGCTSLTGVMIPDSVTDIGDQAFAGCTSLTSVTIGKGLRGIADLFAGCTKLTSINISALHCAYSSFEGLVFNKDRTVLMLCPGGRNTIRIPRGVTSILNQTFAGCRGLQAVYFYGDAPSMESIVFSETMATLFYVSGTVGWETTMAGRPTFEWDGLFGAQSLEMYAGLTIVGEIGKVYSIEYVTDLTEPGESDWRCLEYLQLPASPYLWADKSAPATGKRFYRAVAMEAPENMVFIPPGTFRMGSPENEVDRSGWEGPQTDVIISRSFWMGKCEVTQGEYEAVMGTNPSCFNGVRGEGEEWEINYGTDPTRPVEQVSWHDAVAYCVALTERERLARRIAANAVFRLPTEAEWEYACRAWTSTRFSYGDDPGYTRLRNYAWYGDNSENQTHPVGQKWPNAWGLYDMHGNVSEWCQDWWHHNLSGGIVRDPQGPADGLSRAIRGGGWINWGDWLNPTLCRSAYRNYDGPDFGRINIGFRVVLAPGQ